MKWLWVTILIYILAFGAVTSLRHYNFQTQAWDLGIFTQIMWNVVHGNGMASSLEFVKNHFAVHMSPILYLLAPGYALFPTPYYLLIVQTLALALGAWPLYLLARNVENRVFNILPLAITTYLLYPSLHWINWFDFHPIAFVVPVMLAAFYFAEVKRWRWMSAFLILAASTQEDAVLAVMFFGVYLMVTMDIRRRYIGLIILVLSTLYFVLATQWIMPYFGGGLLRLDRYAHLGNSFEEIFKNIFSNPALFVTTIFQQQKFVYLFWLFLPVAFLPLFAPRTWILLIPGLAQNLLTNYGPQFSGTFQYDATLIPGIFIAAVYGFKKTISFFAGFDGAAGMVPPKAASRANQPFVWLAGPNEKSKKANCFLITALVILSASTFLIRSPISPFNFPAELLKPNAHWENLRLIVSKVPENVSVAAHTNIVPHLAGREKIYMLGFEPILEADAVLIDGADYFGFPSAETFEAHIQKYAGSGKYEAEIIGERYYVLRKKAQLQNSPESFQHD